MDVSTLWWIGILLLIIGLVAYFLGARGIAGISVGLGKTLLVVGVILGIILIMIGMFGGDA